METDEVKKKLDKFVKDEGICDTHFVIVMRKDMTIEDFWKWLKRVK